MSSNVVGPSVSWVSSGSLPWDATALTGYYTDAAFPFGGLAEYGGGKWVAVVELDDPTTTNPRYSFWTNEDARNTSNWQLSSVTAPASIGGLAELYYGNNQWVLLGDNGYRYTAQNDMVFGGLVTTYGSGGSDILWDGARWLRLQTVSPYTVYQASDIAGPWTPWATTATVGFEPGRIGYNGKHYVIIRRLMSYTDVEPCVAISEDGSTWTTVHSEKASYSSTGAIQLTWSSYQNEWIAVWQRTAFGLYQTRARWANSDANTWSPITGPGHTVWFADGDGYQVARYRTSTTSGYAAYRMAESWGDGTAWYTPISGNGITGVNHILYRDGYWLAQHDNVLGPSGNGIISATPEFDDAYWGISLDN